MLSNLLDIEIDIEKIRPGDNKVIIDDNSKIIELTGWQPQISVMDSLHDLIVYWKQILDI
jgi:UDP-glucose 4-epimerase